MSDAEPSKVHLSIEAEDLAEVVRTAERFVAAWNSSGGGAPPAGRGTKGLVVFDADALIAGNRALLAIGAVVLIALLLHTIFWSFVLPLGAIA